MRPAIMPLMAIAGRLVADIPSSSAMQTPSVGIEPPKVAYQE